MHWPDRLAVMGYSSAAGFNFCAMIQYVQENNASHAAFAAVMVCIMLYIASRWPEH